MAVPTIQQLAAQWLKLDKDESTRNEIQRLIDAGDNDELEKRLRSRISFGTAGLRSSMKAGFAHMNALTVLQASHGLAEYILSQRANRIVPVNSSNKWQPSVVIGYDARHNSSKFAQLAAAAFLSKGFKIFWFGNYVHTPMVPFVVSHQGASAGIMITASHNPKNDNGYKVYWSNGSQIIPPHDAGIAAAINRIGEVDTWDGTAINDSPNVETVYQTATKAYMGALRELVWPLPSVEMVMPFTYTPMHGVGLPFLRQIAHDMWFRGNNFRVVRSQADPDPEFPTVPFPNPEEKGALTPAIQDAEASGTTIIIANDPDADRFAAAERIEKGRWHQFTGNEMGILLASHVLESYQGDRMTMVMLASTVSSRMLAAMAEQEGFQFAETLTGFKWLGNVAQDLKMEGLDPVFAYEEAIGYMFPSVVWDKDGVAAAAIFLTAWQRWKKQGKTPYQKLQDLYQKYGYFADANTYLISPSPDTTNKVFAAIRASQDGSPPKTVGSRTIRRWRDLTLGLDTARTDEKPDLPIDPNAQMITCELDNVVFTARGSGTEPKIKLYIEGKGSSAVEAKAVADEVLKDLIAEWFKPSFGLRLAA